MFAIRSLNGSRQCLRGQRVAIMASPLHELTGFYLAVDCRSADCRGERKFAIAELAAFYKTATVGDVLRRMRCTRGCGGRVLAAWLETGPIGQRAGQAAAGAAARARGARVAVGFGNNTGLAIVRAMCGRYASFLPAEAVARLFVATNPLPNSRRRG